MKRVLVLFAHPALEHSRVHRALLASAKRVDGVAVHDLYERYPDFNVNVPEEQALLAEHDRIVIQCPFYWYSVPALVKQWLDLVLEHGWAYGSGGEALKNKWLLLALSTGGGKLAYSGAGTNQHTVREFLRPLEATARLCGMRWLPPLLVQGAHTLDEAQIESHAARYAETLAALRDERVQFARVADAEELTLDDRSA